MVLEHRFRDRDAVPETEGQQNVFVGTVERCHDVGEEETLLEGHAGAQLDLAAVASADYLDEVLLLGQHDPRRLIEPLPRGSQTDSSVFVPHQRHRVALFQTADVEGHGGLGETEVLGRRGVTAPIDDGHEDRGLNRSKPTGCLR